MPHKKAPRFTLALTLSLAFLLASCGGGSSAPAVAEAPGTATPALFVAASQSVTLNAAGGGVTLAGSDGTQYQLVIPAGALTSSTTLTLTTQTPATGQQFNLLLQPAGLVLASGAVGTLTIQLPAGASLPAMGGLVYDGVLVPFTRLADGQIQVSLSAFASSLPLTARATGEAQPIGALKRIAAASSSVCGSAPVLQTNGGLAAVTAVDIELYGQCMVAAVQESFGGAPVLEPLVVGTTVVPELLVPGVSVVLPLEVVEVVSPASESLQAGSRATQRVSESRAIRCIGR